MSEEKNENYTPTPFLGLAPFLRRSLAGENLMPLAQALWVEAAENQNSANAWMNLAVALECIGDVQGAQNAQNVALSLSSIFVRPPSKNPVSMRVLCLKVPGNLSSNAPLDCLFENDDVELIDYFFNPHSTDFDFSKLPPCDVIVGAMGYALNRQAWLEKLNQALQHVKKPMVNSISAILNTRRDQASRLMQNVQNVLMPLQFLFSKQEVQALSSNANTLPKGLAYPLIIRPENSHGGKNLEKISDCAQLLDYLSRVDCAHYFLSSFVDYQNQEGLYSKMRIAVVNGKAYPVHMAVSSKWVVHYVNAFMQNAPENRKKERLWMENFEEFAKPYENLWQTLKEKIGLDYCCVDCAQMPNGDLLIFEFDHISVVHDMDDPLRFPYKSAAIARIKDALRDFFFEI